MGLGFKKRKAGALSLTVGISLVISILLSSMVLVSYYHQLSQINDEGIIVLERNLDSAIELVKADNNRFNDRSVATDLFHLGSDSVLIKVQPWGLFQNADVMAVKGRLVRKRIAMLGAYSSNNQLRALTLIDDHRSNLVLLGAATIQGDASVPGGRLTTGMFGNTRFNGGGVQGTVTPSNSELLPVNEQQIVLIRQLINGTIPAEMNVLQEIPQKLEAPFQEVGHYYSHRDRVHLHHDLKGKMIIHSFEQITVSFSSHLEDVILVAPRIVIDEFVKGSFQAFARDSLIVKSGARLIYPSVLGLFSDQSARLTLSSAHLHGSVLALSSQNDKKPVVSIDRGSVVMGEVHVNGFLELYGKVSGTVSCEHFLLNSRGEIRENNLLDGVINRGELSEAFLFPILYSTNSKFGVIKWLSD